MVAATITAFKSNYFKYLRPIHISDYRYRCRASLPSNMEAVLQHVKAVEKTRPQKLHKWTSRQERYNTGLFEGVSKVSEACTRLRYLSYRNIHPEAPAPPGNLSRDNHPKAPVPPGASTVKVSEKKKFRRMSRRSLLSRSLRD